MRPGVTVCPACCHTSQTEPRSAPRSSLKVQNTFHWPKSVSIAGRFTASHATQPRRRGRREGGQPAAPQADDEQRAEQEQRVELGRGAEADQHPGQHRPAARPRPQRAGDGGDREQVPVDQPGEHQGRGGGERASRPRGRRRCTPARNQAASRANGASSTAVTMK